uniref:Retropepsins domain-containing protein n=1 Tax=Trichuris muris TaxID=70415 RepID=A0A5S6QSM3_TRIMR
MGHLSGHCPDRRRPSTNGQPTNNANSTAMSLRSNGNNRQGMVLYIMVNVGGKDMEALVQGWGTSGPRDHSIRPARSIHTARQTIPSGPRMVLHASKRPAAAKRFPTPALVDTGAVSCFANRNLVLQNGINVDPWIGPAFPGVDGRTLITVGRAKLTVMYEGQPLNIDVAALADPPCTLALGTEALMKLGVGIEFSPYGWQIKRIVRSLPPTLEKKGSKGTDKLSRDDASEMRPKGKVTSEQPAPSPAVTGRLINEVESVILLPARELPLAPHSAARETVVSGHYPANS